MATYKILYWQEIPSQIKAEDELDDLTVPMPDRFQERIDLMAARRGLEFRRVLFRSVSQAFADEIGADGYGANASAAVDLFLRLAAKSTDRKSVV